MKLKLMRLKGNGLNVVAYLGAAALVLYYLVPFAVPALGFSPHVLLIIAGFIFLLMYAQGHIEFWYGFLPLSFVIVAVISVFGAPNMPKTQLLHTWLVSLMAFGLFRNTFKLLPQERVNTWSFVVLAIWAFVAIAQVLFGNDFYVSNWFGAPIVAAYASGLTIYSNNAAIMLLPLLVWALVSSINQPVWWRGFVWTLGCVALYFTLSRAGWLALLIAMLVLVARYRHEPIILRNLALHAVVAMLAVLLVWGAPTRIDPFEPGGLRSAGRWRALDYSGATRLVTLQVAAKAAAEYPLTGIGMGRFPDYYAKHYAEYLNGAAVDPRILMTPHNGYAQFVAEVGIPAFLSLLIWMVWLTQRTAKRKEPAAHALFASIVGMASWLFLHDGLYDRQLWMLLGCATALSDKNLLLRGKL